MELDSISDDQLSKNLAKYSLLLTKLSTLSQVNKLSSIIKYDHIKKTQALNDFIHNTHTQQNKQIRKIELKRTDLTSSLAHFHNVLAPLSESNHSAKIIHSDIYNKDIEHKYLERTLSFLESIRTLKNDIILINSAIKQSNYLVAAKGIYEINQLPKDILESKFAQAIIPTPDLPYSAPELLTMWTDQLRDLFKDKFSKAMVNNDIPTLTEYFQLFPLINEPTLGLNLYSKYITNIVAQENQKFTMGSLKLDSRFDLILLQLFKIASTIINEHSKIISKAYGIQYMTYVMEKLEVEVELQCCLVWNYFQEKKLSNIIISDYNQNDADDYREDNRDKTNKNNNSLPNTKLLVNEFSCFLQNWSMYCRFFSVRWNEFLHSESNSSIEVNMDSQNQMFENVNNSNNKNFNNKATMESEDNTLSIAPPILNGSFLRRLQKDKSIQLFQELSSNYLITSFRRSIELEEIPSLNELITDNPITHEDPSSWPISSVLEDLTLLLRQTLVNNVNTGQFNIVENLLIQLPKFFQNEFLVKFLQNKFRSLQSKLSTGTLIVLKKYQPKISTREQDKESIGSPRTSLSKLYSGTDNSGISITSNILHSNNSNNNNNNIATSTSTTGKFNLRGAFANIQSNLHSVVTVDEDNSESILALHHYLIYVNTSYLIVLALKKLLIQEIIDDNPKLLVDNFPFYDESDKIKKLLFNCEDKMIIQVKKLQNWSIKYLFQTICLPKIKPLFDTLFTNTSQNKYVCGIEDFENMRDINTFVQKWNQLMQPYENVLYQKAYTDLLRLIVNFLKHLIEKKLWNLKVNELGAIKLDRELSLFIGTICGTHYAIRDSFTKLTQIVLILGFDDDDFDVSSGDVKEELATSIEWVLSPRERIQARNLKVDKRI